MIILPGSNERLLCLNICHYQSIIVHTKETINDQNIKSEISQKHRTHPQYDFFCFSKLNMSKYCWHSAVVPCNNFIDFRRKH